MSLSTDGPTDTSTADLVVLLADDGTPIGTAPRAEVHTTDTPLHLAFSCYLLDADGALLVTRRALTKRTWPGVWTNSFCGHPRPGETPHDAVRRHAAHELGVTVDAVEPLLPDFRYRAVDAAGVVENEVCPVFTAVTADPVRANPDEVAEHAWVAAADVLAVAERAPWALSPWLVGQVDALRLLAGRLGAPAPASAIAGLLDAERVGLGRVTPDRLADEVAAGALVVDTRPVEQRERDGDLPGALVVDRNVLEWRLDPTSPDRLPEAADPERRVIVVCNEGYSSSLAARTLVRLGLRNATDLAGGFQAWRAFVGRG